MIVKFQCHHLLCTLFNKDFSSQKGTILQNITISLVQRNIYNLGVLKPVSYRKTKLDIYIKVCVKYTHMYNS